MQTWHHVLRKSHSASMKSNTCEDEARFTVQVGPGCQTRAPSVRFDPLERFPFRRTISRIREVCSAFRSRDLIKTRGDHLAEAPDGERGILQSWSLIHISEPTRLGMISYAV